MVALDGKTDVGTEVDDNNDDVVIGMVTKQAVLVPFFTKKGADWALTLASPDAITAYHPWITSTFSQVTVLALDEMLLDTMRDTSGMLVGPPDETVCWTTRSLVTVSANCTWEFPKYVQENVVFWQVVTFFGGANCRTGDGDTEVVEEVGLAEDVVREEDSPADTELLLVGGLSTSLRVREGVMVVGSESSTSCVSPSSPCFPSTSKTHNKTKGIGTR